MGQVTESTQSTNGCKPKTQLSTEDTTFDCISRQAAIDAPFKKFDADTGVTWIPLEHIEQLPSAQPEIIRCRKCKFASGDSRICMKFGHSPIGELDFCAWAERKEE